jgi:hypothetical protein
MQLVSKLSEKGLTCRLGLVSDEISAEQDTITSPFRIDFFYDDQCLLLAISIENSERSQTKKNTTTPRAFTTNISPRDTCQ